MAGKYVDWHEVQGIVLSGYSDKPNTRYFLLTIVDVAAACAWLGNELQQRPPTISFGDDRTKDGCSVNIAFTSAGLEKMGLPKDAIDTFPWDFRDGMASPLRRRILADFDRNDPGKWRWGRLDQDLHVLVMVYATKAELTKCATALERRWKNAFQILAKLDDGYRLKDSREHFGFVDGLSQPAIETSPRSQRLRERGDVDGIIQPGEFVLGYVNERGQLPVSPSVAAVPNSRLAVITNADRSVSGHPPGAMFPRLDFGRNGTFLVYRQLEQDVFAFADLIENAAKLLGDGSTPCLSDEDDNFRRLLAAKIIGRWDDGTSLALAPNSPPRPGSNLQTVNSFGYAEEDRYGLRCPIGAHVRRANPRDTLDDDRQAAIRRIKRHRLLRRGRIYGKRTFGEGNSGWHAWDTKKKRPADIEERGLHFVAINASIESQFEFIQQTWMNTPFFGELTDELDPLIGMPDKGDNTPRFTIQSVPVNRRFLLSWPLVTVRGGAYFFLPSRAALEFLAG